MFQLSKIFHISHVVDNLDDACRWYDDLFAPRVWQRSEQLGVPLALLVVGDVVFMPMAPSADFPSSAVRFRERFGPHLHSLAIYVEEPDDFIVHLRGRGLRLTGAAGEDLTDPQDEIWTQPRETPMMFEFFEPRPSMNDPRLEEADWSSSFWRDEHPLRIQDACTTLVTSDLEGAVAFLVDGLHGKLVHESPSTPYATRSSFVSLNNEVTIEAAEPLDGESRAGRDLVAGGKFHAVTLRVGDLDRAVEHVTAKGIGVERPADGHVVLDPADCLGVQLRFTDREIAAW